MIARFLATHWPGHGLRRTRDRRAVEECAAPPPSRRGGRAAVVALALILILAGCGGEPEPTATAPTSEPSQTSQPSPGSPDSTASATGGQSGATDATAEAELTLGELIDRINARWTGLNRFLETNSFTAAGNPNLPGTPLAASPATQRTGRSVREVILPAHARYVAEENDRLLFEMIVDGDQVYARGTVAMLLDPSAEPGEWIVTDMETVARNPMLGEAAASQLGVLTPPRYEVPERLRPQTVRELGITEYGDTTCTLYGAADTTATGARIDFTFGIDDSDLLCFVQTESIGISSLYVVSELAGDAEILPPDSARRLDATPAASPVSLASPIAGTDGVDDQ